MLCSDVQTYVDILSTADCEDDKQPSFTQQGPGNAGRTAYRDRERLQGQESNNNGQRLQDDCTSVRAAGDSTESCSLQIKGIASIGCYSVDDSNLAVDEEAKKHGTAVFRKGRFGGNVVHALSFSLARSVQCIHW